MTLRRTAGAAIVSALLLALAAPAADAETKTTVEEYRGAASGRALDLTLLGETLTFGAGTGDAAFDAVGGSLDATAAGVGTALAADTMVSAGLGEQTEGCANDLLPGELDDAVTSALGALHVGLDLACGEASVTQDGESFASHGAGRVSDISVTTASLFEDERLEPLAPILDETFGAIEEVARQVEENDDDVEEGIETALGELQGVLDEAFGPGNVQLPDLDPSDTLRNLVDRVQKTRLLDVSIGRADSSVVGDASSLRSEALDEGGSIELMPGFWPDGDALVRVSVGKSTAAVTYDRAVADTEAVADNTIVRIESRLLPAINLGAIGEDVSLPLDEFTERMGYSSGPGFLELKPGEGVELFCDSADSLGQEIGTATGGLLCTEISVGQPQFEEISDGDLQGQRARASSVTVHVAKGVGADTLGASASALPDLGVAIPTEVGDALAGPAGGTALPGLLGGVSPADASDGGIRLDVAGSVAEVMGTKTQVKSAPSPEPGEGELPRTGGFGALPTVAAGLLGAGAGLGALLRRRGV